MAVGSFYTDIGEDEKYVGPDPAPLPAFKVERSDGSHVIVDAVDEADAMRQANNSYVGPAIIVAVTIYHLNIRRT